MFGSVIFHATRVGTVSIQTVRNRRSYRQRRFLPGQCPKDQGLMSGSFLQEMGGWSFGMEEDVF